MPAAGQEPRRRGDYSCMETITCDPSEIRLSNHCVDRFLERFRPALDWSSAKRELHRLLGCGTVGAMRHPGSPTGLFRRRIAT